MCVCVCNMSLHRNFLSGRLQKQNCQRLHLPHFLHNCSCMTCCWIGCFKCFHQFTSETPTTAHVSLQTCDSAVLNFVENNLLVVATLGVVLVLVEVSCAETLIACPGHPANCRRVPLSRLQVVVFLIAICLLYSTEYS